MPEMPWFRITLLNRAAGDTICARFATHQAPSEGQLVFACSSSYTADTPFEGHSLWRVEQVLWNVSSPVSQNAIDWKLEHRTGPGRLGTWDGGVCLDADLYVWPANVPGWHPDPPPWAPRRPEEADEPGAAVNP